MDITVSEMDLPQTELVVDYFHQLRPEHLETLGVDPTRLPKPSAWRDYFRHEFALPVRERRGYFSVWMKDGRAVGFSSCDKIVFGEHAYMHLHVTSAALRGQGVGVECVRRSADLYFRVLQLKQLFCEPNAFNVAPNRTLQKAGFKYVKTHMTVPGPLNFHQAVTRWIWER